MTGLPGRSPAWDILFSDQAVSNVLHRHNRPPTRERKRTTTWAEFIRAHRAPLANTVVAAENTTLTVSRQGEWSCAERLARIGKKGCFQGRARLSALSRKK
jgi:hypothetical protein